MCKFYRDIVAQKSHRDSVDSPLDLKTPARIRTSPLIKNK
jgi:hypothetical protein